MNANAQRAMTATEWSLLLLLSLMWGGSFFFIGIGVKALPPFTIVASRVCIATILLWLAAPLSGVSAARLRGQAPALVVLALLNNVAPFSLLVWSQTHLASGLVSILNATTPVFTVVVAHFFTVEEKLDARRLGGALIGLAGVAAMIGPALLGGFAGHLVAELAALLAALSYAAASVFARRFRRLGLRPIDVATGQVTASSFVLLPVAALVDAPWRLPAPGGAAITAIAALGAVSTALAYVVYFRVLAGAGAVNVVLVTLLAPATAILLGAAALGESLAARDFVGLGLIALGLAVIDGRLPAAAGARLAAAGRLDSPIARARDRIVAQETGMAIERDNPGDLARRAAERRGRRSNPRLDTNQWRRESFCLPRLLARAKARELFERYPKAAYMTEIEFWIERDDGQIEFVVRRLPSAD